MDNKELYKRMLYKMIEARLFEECVQDLFNDKKLHGTTHLAIGQEGSGIGACFAMGKDDLMISNHRSHVHALGAGMNINKIMAELFGKEAGYSKGKGGSMHLADVSLGCLGSNGVVAGGFPIACGAALTQKYKQTGKAVLCFGGDGSTNEGNFHESLNLASVWQLPVVFFIENNFYGLSTPVGKHMHVDSIADRAKAYNIPGIKIDGNDILEVYQITKRAFNHARTGKGPVLIEAETYRYNGHSKSDRQVYRSQAEVTEWKKKDPIVRFENYLLSRNVLTDTSLERMNVLAENQVKEAVRFAENADEPAVDTVMTEIYA